MSIEPAPRVLITVAPYYRHITDMLIAGATAALDEANATWEVVEVSGAFELPAAVAIALDAEEQGATDERFDAFLLLGCVIRGETSHYDLICNEVARATQDLATIRGATVGFGLLTCENEAQALVRADPSKKDKGREAVAAVLSTLALKQRFGTYVR